MVKYAGRICSAHRNKQKVEDTAYVYTTQNIFYFIRMYKFACALSFWFEKRSMNGMAHNDINNGIIKATAATITTNDDSVVFVVVFVEQQPLWQ